jgi:hypothetical protein
LQNSTIPSQFVQNNYFQRTQSTWPSVSVHKLRSIDKKKKHLSGYSLAHPPSTFVPQPFQTRVSSRHLKMQFLSHRKHTVFNTKIIIILHGLGRLTCSGIEAFPSFPGSSTISSPSRFVVEGVFRQSGFLPSLEMADPVFFYLYFDLTSCIPEIFSSFLMTLLLILSSLVYPLTF